MLLKMGVDVVVALCADVVVAKDHPWIVGGYAESFLRHSTVSKARRDG